MKICGQTRPHTVTASRGPAASPGVGGGWRSSLDTADGEGASKIKTRPIQIAKKITNK